MNIRNGKIPQLDPANKKPYYLPALLVSYWNMTREEAGTWYNDQFQITVKQPEYTSVDNAYGVSDDDFERY